MHYRRAAVGEVCSTLIFGYLSHGGMGRECVGRGPPRRMAKWASTGFGSHPTHVWVPKLSVDRDRQVVVTWTGEDLIVHDLVLDRLAVDRVAGHEHGVPVVGAGKGRVEAGTNPPRERLTRRLGCEYGRYVDRCRMVSRDGAHVDET